MKERTMPASNRSRGLENRTRDSKTGTPTKAHANSPQESSGDSAAPATAFLLGSDYGAETFERHAALLGDARLSQPVYARHRDAIVRQMQRQYGNGYVLRVVDQVQRSRNMGVSRNAFDGQVQRAPDEEDLPIDSRGGEVDASTERTILQARGGGKPLPDGLRGQMESEFGSDFSSVRVHTGKQSDALNESIGARAFTTGRDIFFRDGEYEPESTDGKEVLAHELTHVIQQGGDARCTSKADHSPGIQRYQDYTDTDGNYRLSDEEGMAVKEESAEGGQEVWATKKQMDDANKKLLKAKSAIMLVSNGGSWGPFPKGTTLTGVAPRIRDLAADPGDSTETETLKAANRTGKEQEEDSEGVKDETLALWTDCGEASRVVTGGMVAGSYKKGKISYTSRKSYDPSVFSDSMYGKVIFPFMEADVSTPYLKEGVHYEEDKIDKDTWLLLAPKNKAQAKKMYWSLGDKGRDEFDKFAGINAYANPNIGETYTIISESDMPGYKESGFTWNFHWAGVIMKDGGDNLTLEGYAVMAGDKEIEDIKKKYKGKERKKKLQELEDKYASWVNRSWVVQMYGTKQKDQTFHEQHLGSGTHGNRATTMTAKKKK
jgi:hypothetical protein